MKRTPLKRKTPLRQKSKLNATDVSHSKRQTSRSTLLRNADRAFSLYIRTRDSQQYNARYFSCISCGRILPISQADCGHYINRANMSLRFSELNCNAQCRHCNRFREGNIQDYRRGLIDKIGEQKVLLLEALKHSTHKITSFDLQVLAKHYKELTKKFKYQIK